MAQILVTYFSGTGNTRKMAESVAEGAGALGCKVTIKPVNEVSPEELRTFDAIIAGSPTYYGMMSCEVKKLFDRSVKYHGQLKGKVGGAFSCSAHIGGGNETTVISILQAMLIHGMVVQGTPMGDHYGPVAAGMPDERSLKQCRELGERVARLSVKLLG